MDSGGRWTLDFGSTSKWFCGPKQNPIYFIGLSFLICKMKLGGHYMSTRIIVRNKQGFISAWHIVGCLVTVTSLLHPSSTYLRHTYIKTISYAISYNSSPISALIWNNTLLPHSTHAHPSTLTQLLAVLLQSHLCRSLFLPSDSNLPNITWAFLN